jgi:hypothetical protein
MTREPTSEEPQGTKQTTGMDRREEWSMRDILLFIAALALGCGSSQHLMDPSQGALVDGFPPPHPGQQRPGKDGKCRVPKGWPEAIVKNGACWVPLDATPEECVQANRKNPYHVLYAGRCWYFLPGDNEKREPTSTTAPEQEGGTGSERTAVLIVP